MIWKFLKQNVLFPKGMNWVQHWVSRIGLCLNHTLNECLGPSLLGWNLLTMVNRAFSIMPFSVFTYTCTLILFKIFWKSLQLYIISVRILQLVSLVHETCLSDLSGVSTGCTVTYLSLHFEQCLSCWKRRRERGSAWITSSLWIHLNPTSGLANLVLSRQTGLSVCEHPFTDKLTVIAEPTVPSAWLLGLGMKLYPRTLSAWSANILFDLRRVFLE